MIEIDHTSRYVFKVEISNGSISEYKAYTRSKKEEPWKRTNEKGNIEQVISETLKPYHKINIDIKGGMSVNISQDEDYTIDMYQEGEDYKMSYEVKNETLYVKQKLIGNKFHSMSEENWLDITVPAGTQIDEITINQNACTTYLEHLSFDKMKIQSNAGNVDIDSCIGNEVVINLQSGNIDYEASKIKSGKISIEAGNSMLGGIESNSLEVNCNTGNIFFEAGMKGAVKAHTNAGNIFVEDGNSTECQYDLSSTYGNIVRE